MRPNNDLRLHFINVNHGDAIIIEFPDFGSPLVHFGIVDLGAERSADRESTRDYLEALIKLRQDGDPELDYKIDFVCVTHPHDDHWGGLKRFMKRFSDADNSQNNRVRNFWDCGFWISATSYLQVLDNIQKNDHITFTRVSSGNEYEYGDVRIIILAPSVDLRNRFDTYGIGINDSSVIMKIQYKKSEIILSGDAEFASWAKVIEEFPRRSHTTFHSDAIGLAERREGTNQLNCQLLKLSHHGSKHGTFLEALEQMNPSCVVIPAGTDDWYENVSRHESGLFPHALVTDALKALPKVPRIYNTGEVGNLIFKITGTSQIADPKTFLERPDADGFDDILVENW